MPGIGSNVDKTKLGEWGEMFASRIHLGIIFVILVIEIVGMIRFYYIFPQMCYGVESMGLTLFWVFADFMIVRGIYRTKDSDPGYLIPSPASKPKDK